MVTKLPINVEGTYVSQKINKVRWIPEDYGECKYFFTGSWDDEQNSIKVWTFDYINEEREVQYPRELSQFNVDGNVTEIKFIDKTHIAASTSEGSVRILQISSYDRHTPLRQIYSWNKLHNYGDMLCSCTSLDTMEGDIATAGEDGTVKVLSSRRGEVIRSINGADSCSIHSICYIKHNEIITGNVRGHMKIWDLRSPDNKPAASFLFAGDELATTCIIKHPTQPHFILAGSESGALAVWDLRIDTFPASLLKAHASCVTEMQFHPENPKKLITCSVSGELWDWNMEVMTKRTKTSENWLPLEDKNAVTVNSLMPPLHKAINTFHCDKSRLLCGADNEALYFIKNLKY
ncbi:nucleoporin Nup43 [Battus philenor]|uniref:nucleoporin Nup43 n=1 Tax=Battus philenor TaxID=42288 RepID=UPI0035CF7F60